MPQDESSRPNLDRDLLIEGTTIETTAALNFKESHFWNEEEGFVQIDAKLLKALTTYLKERYGVYEVETRGAYIILRCELKVPDLDQRPFTIAGRVGVWLEAMKKNQSILCLALLDNLLPWNWTQRFLPAYR